MWDLEISSAGGSSSSNTPGTSTHLCTFKQGPEISQAYWKSGAGYGRSECADGSVRTYRLTPLMTANQAAGWCSGGTPIDLPASAACPVSENGPCRVHAQRLTATGVKAQQQTHLTPDDLSDPLWATGTDPPARPRALQTSARNGGCCSGSTPKRRNKNV
jgi:hypothetical protein